MDFSDIERILDLVRQHDLAEFELEKEGLKLRVRKAGALPPHSRRTHSTRCRLAYTRRFAARVAGVTTFAGWFTAYHRRGRGVGGACGREITDCRHVLSVAGAGRSGVCRGRPAGEEGSGALHHRGDEADERDRRRSTDGEIVSAYVENGKPVQYGERLFAIRRRSQRHYVQEDPDCEPRRDRAARHLRVPRARHQDRRRLFGGRRELAARPLRRRGRLHRPGAQRRQLPERAGDHQRRRDHRRRRDSSRATASSPRAPTWPRSARRATSSSSARRRT